VEDEKKFGVPADQLAAQAEREHLDRLVERTTPGVLVVHVDVTEEAWRDGSFRKVLERERIAWADEAAGDPAKESLVDENLETARDKYNAAAGATEAVYVEAPPREIKAVLARLAAESREGASFQAMTLQPPAAESAAADYQASLARFYRAAQPGDLKELGKSVDREQDEMELRKLLYDLAVAESAPANESGGSGKSLPLDAAEKEDGEKNGEAKGTADPQADAGLESLAGDVRRESAIEDFRGRAVRLAPPTFGDASAAGRGYGGGLGGGLGGGFGGAAPGGGGGALPGASRGGGLPYVPGGPAGQAGATPKDNDDEPVPNGSTNNAESDVTAAFALPAGEARTPVWFFFHIRPTVRK
jgi:hypothetical protein